MNIAIFLRTAFYRVPLVAASDSYKVSLCHFGMGKQKDPLADKTYCIYQFKEKKVICSFRNMILVQIVLGKIIPRNDDLFKVICD